MWLAAFLALLLVICAGAAVLAPQLVQRVAEGAAFLLLILTAGGAFKDH